MVRPIQVVIQLKPDLLRQDIEVLDVRLLRMLRHCVTIDQMPDHLFSRNHSQTAISSISNNRQLIYSISNNQLIDKLKDTLKDDQLVRSIHIIYQS